MSDKYTVIQDLVTKNEAKTQALLKDQKFKSEHLIKLWNFKYNKLRDKAERLAKKVRDNKYLDEELRVIAKEFILDYGLPEVKPTEGNQELDKMV